MATVKTVSQSAVELKALLDQRRNLKNRQHEIEHDLNSVEMDLKDSLVRSGMTDLLKVDYGRLVKFLRHNREAV